LDDATQAIPWLISDLEVPVLVGGCATYHSALRLMRARMATALAPVAVRRRTGSRPEAPVATATRAADAAAIDVPLARAGEDPGQGWHPGAELRHESLPCGSRVHLDAAASLEEFMRGPAPVSDGTMNLMGPLPPTLALTGSRAVRQFQRIELVVRRNAPTP
jgi:IMP dehydrogenase